MINKLKEALKDVEGIDLSQLSIMPIEDLNTLKTNYQDELDSTKKKSEELGKTIGVEMFIKENMRELGIEYQNRKDTSLFIPNLKKKFIEEAGITPEVLSDKHVAEMKDLQQRLADKDEEIETIKTGFKQESNNKMIDSMLQNQFSSFADKTVYKVDDLVTIAKSKNQFGVVDGSVVQMKNGEPLKNDTYQPITVELFVQGMMNEGYLKKTEGGSINGDETTGGKITMDQFIASQSQQGVNIGSVKFNENLTTAIDSGSVE